MIAAFRSRVGPLLAVGLALACAVLVAGCNGRDQTASAAGPMILEFWNGFTGPDGKTMEKIVRQFNKEHPRTQVRMQMIPWGTYYDKLTLGLAYGGAPDVFIMHASRLPEYADSDAVARVDDLVRSPGFPASDFTPRAWAAARWKGKQYAIPLDCHPIGLYYNTELFKKAGIVDARGDAKPPKTLAEFLDDARKLTRDTNGDGMPEQWGFVYTWLRTNAHTFLAQEDTGLLTPDNRRSAFDGPKARVAFDLMSDLIYKYKVCPRPEGVDAWMGFQTNRVGMALEGIYMLSSLESQKDLHFAGAPCPVFGKHPAVWGDSHLLLMPRGINAGRRKAAWEFMRYLSDHSLEWSKGGQVPVRKSILARADFRKLQVQYAFSQELPYVVYMPRSTAVNQIQPFSDAAIEAVLNRIRPTDLALQEAARRTNNVLERP